MGQEFRPSLAEQFCSTWHQLWFSEVLSWPMGWSEGSVMASRTCQAHGWTWLQGWAQQGLLIRELSLQWTRWKPCGFWWPSFEVRKDHFCHTTCQSDHKYTRIQRKRTWTQPLNCWVCKSTTSSLGWKPKRGSQSLQAFSQSEIVAVAALPGDLWPRAGKEVGKEGSGRAKIPALLTMLPASALPGWHTALQSRLKGRVKALTCSGCWSLGTEKKGGGQCGRV